MEASNYNILEKILHGIALSTDAVGDITLLLDRVLVGKAVKGASELPHVFISGLARSGTSILLRSINESGQFCSLTYRDMPFVLAPSLWRKISSFSDRDLADQQRAHGDGLMVSIDSPEALEEVFWRVKCRDEYVRPDRLMAMECAPALAAEFAQYVARIVSSRSSPKPLRYLSKNNNNILRLSLLREAFPNCILIIPFRSPLQHAFSLLKQHRRFLDIHTNDPFTLRYMNWLVHHEFGANHKPFFSVDNVAKWDALSLEYWLAEWVTVYDYLLANAPKRVCFLSYDDLCIDERVWPLLAQYIGLDTKISRSSPFRTPAIMPIDGVDSELERRASDIHQRLMGRFAEVMEAC